MNLVAIPLDLAEANAFVAKHHRHHRPVVGHKFSIGAARGDAVVGVAIIGRPVARGRDDGLTLEVTRLCTDGSKNACSFLYGAAARAAFALGYKRIGTYTLPEEGGGKSPSHGLENDRRTRRRILVLQIAAARRHASPSNQTPVGA